MKIFWIGPYDQKYNNGLFYNLTGDGPRRPWPLYADLACPRCMKVPEDVAIARGFDPSFKVRLSGDIACTHDGVYLFSKRAQEFVLSQGIAGLRFEVIPNEERYVFAFPIVFADLERPNEMLRYDSACPTCGRRKWVGFGYEQLAFNSMLSARTIFQPNPWLEDAFARSTTLFCGEEVADLFVAAKRAKRLQKFFVNELSKSDTPRKGAPMVFTPVLQTCTYCKGSGNCYCVRTGAESSEGCPRCNGSRKCHVCKGVGRK